jgi:uncharacterized protein YbbK (DUF523 family)
VALLIEAGQAVTTHRRSLELPRGDTFEAMCAGCSWTARIATEDEVSSAYVHDREPSLGMSRYLLSMFEQTEVEVSALQPGVWISFSSVRVPT